MDGMCFRSKLKACNKRRVILVAIFGIGMGMFFNCSNDDVEVKDTPTPYQLIIPGEFPVMKVPEENPLTIEGVALGRRLYYDNILDMNESRSCASCHIQSKSFSSDGEVIPHINLGWSRNFLWDGKINGTLEDVMYFESERFFQTNLTKLNTHPEYPELFKIAFDVNTITYNDIAKALAQFSRTMISGNSKFDRVVRNEENFTEEEYRGYNLFFTEEGDCFHCHATVFFTDNMMHNNALDADPDPGFYNVTGNPLDFGKFKSPTLRNLEFTAPYMHDGRYNTLEEVVDFYSHGLKKSNTVDPLMKNLSEGGLQLSSEDKSALVAFLKTLSDSEYLTNPDLSNPNN